MENWISCKPHSWTDSTNSKSRPWFKVWWTSKDGSFKVLNRNFQKLLIEIFKVNMKHAPEIMNDIFDITEYTYPPTNKTFAL